MTLHDVDLNWLPLFLGGPPKSGTTLLQALLDSHPEIMVFPEEAKLVQIICSPTLRQWLLPANVEWLLAYGPLSKFKVDLQKGEGAGLQDYSSIEFTRLAAHARELWQHSDRSPADLLSCAIVAFAETMGETGKRYWAEKTPDNERYGRALRRHWPDMKLVAVYREPRDNFVSYARHRLRRREERLSPARFILSWTKSLAACLRFVANTGAGMIITYERLVADPKVEMRRVADFLGVAFSDSMLQPTRCGTPWGGNSVHFLSRSAKVTTQSVGIHRQHLSPALAQAFPAILAPVYDAFGWEHGGSDRSSTDQAGLPASIEGSVLERYRASRAIAALQAALRAYRAREATTLKDQLAKQ